MEPARLCRILLYLVGVILIGRSLPQVIPASIDLARQQVPVARVTFPVTGKSITEIVHWVFLVYTQFFVGLHLLGPKRIVTKWCLSGIQGRWGAIEPGCATSEGPSMTPAQLARLLLRITGVLLIGMSLPQVLSTAIQVLFLRSSFNQLPFPPTVDSTITFLTMLGRNYGQFAFGLYLLLRGELIVGLCVRALGSGCGKCGYDLTGLAGGKCPECGTERAGS